ncbi:MAG TPA: ABC transporter permease subunit [Fibrobacteria bacterium]|nr:ABC transporter permease subunit [Fibrobacteria bacterium]
MRFGSWRRRGSKLFWTGLLAVIALLNLLPILWMVFSSLKDNRDLQAGSLGFSRSQSRLVAMLPRREGVLVGTTNGDIHLIRLESHGLVVRGTRSLDIFAAAYSLQEETLWVLSGQDGILQVDASSLSERQRWPMSRIRQAFLERLPNGTWPDLDPVAVEASSILAVGDQVFATFRSKAFPGVIVLDRKSGGIRFLVFGQELPFAIDQFLDLGRGRVAMVGDKGVVLWQTAPARTADQFLWGQDLPAERVALVVALDDSLLLCQRERADVYSLPGRKVVRTIDTASGLRGGRILAVTADDRRIWFGTAGGIYGVDRRAGTQIEDDDSLQLLAPEHPEGNPWMASGVLGVAYSGGRLWMGGSQGEIAMGKISGSLEVERDGRLPEGKRTLRFENFRDLWQKMDFGSYLRNSLIISLGVTVLSVALALFSAYALARLRFPGKEAFSLMSLATQAIPGVAFLIPLFMTFLWIQKYSRESGWFGDRGVQLVGAWWGVILLYAVFFVPFSIWILRAFFQALPKDLEAAAQLDGCSRWGAFWKVAVPAVRPGIVVTGVYVFLSVWDELLFAWVLTAEKTYTVPVGIRLFAGNYQTRFDLMMAAATVATLPVLVLFFLLQRRIVAGIAPGLSRR